MMRRQIDPRVLIYVLIVGMLAYALVWALEHPAACPGC